MTYCSQCGQQSQEGDLYCGNCGNTLRTSQDRASATDVPKTLNTSHSTGPLIISPNATLSIDKGAGR